MDLKRSRKHVAAIFFICCALALFFYNIALSVGCNCEEARQHVWNSKLQRWRHKHGMRINAMSEFKATERTVYDLFEPEWNCDEEDRIGKVFGDGGKFICGISTLANVTATDCLVYSIGSNYDTTFEQHVRQLTKCEMHTFDPTIHVERLADVASQYNFQVHPWGLGTHHANVNALTLSNIMERLNHVGKTINILKIDCEGCEHEALAEVFQLCADGKLKIEQLAIEIHSHKNIINPPTQPVTPGDDYNKAVSFFKGADKCGLVIFHKERNHWGCDGYGCIEYSLISKQAARRVFESTHTCSKM